MGEWKVSKTCRWTREELDDVELLNKAYAPFTNGFTSVLRLALKVLKAITFTPERVRDYVEVCHHLRCMKVQDKQLSIHFPAETPFFPKIHQEAE
jgi:hypothetical protein